MPWETVGADLFMLNYKTCLCIVNYHSKFQVMKLTNGISANSLIKTCKITFSEYGLYQSIVSDTDKKIVMEMF